MDPARDEDGGLRGRLEEGNRGGSGGDGDRGGDRVRRARNKTCRGPVEACATAARERRGAGQPGGDGVEQYRRAGSSFVFSGATA